jgi:hypothetical protein
MPVNLRTGRLRPTLVARILIAATLTVALVSGIAPFGLTASVHLCTMSCCAGKAPHEAGSCHANFSVSKPPSPSKEQEEHCGTTVPQMAQHGEMNMQDAPSPIEEDLSTADYQPHLPADSLAHEQSPQNNSQQATNINASVLTKPCPSDCGTRIFSYSSQSRPRDSASLSYADKPRPPSSPRLQRTSDNVDKALDALCRRSRPRGPPLSFS